MAVVRAADPECAALRTEFHIPYRNSWVVVLDGKGETLASWIGDAAGAKCDDDTARSFPKSLVALIRKCLQGTESVQELERRWRSNMRDTVAFDRLAQRLEHMEAFGRLQQLCEEAATISRLARQTRDDFRLRAFIAGADDDGRKRSGRNARARFLREGERLLVELADQPRAKELVGQLFSRGYAHTFDMPARSARGLARLQRAAGKLTDPVPLQERIRELAELREQCIARVTEMLHGQKRREIRDYYAAYLGDARAAIRFYSKYEENPEYRRWLQEARKKLARQQRHANVADR